VGRNPKAMHELPIVTRILELALASTPEGARVLGVDLAIGVLCDAEPRWLERYFRVAARGTACAEAELRVERLPALLVCPGCGDARSCEATATELVDLLRGPCPACGTAGRRLEGGAEYSLESIEIVGGEGIEGPK